MPLAGVIKAEIEREGPIAFSRFMELALYHPEYGYYLRERERFGRAGDFYTAEQLQPVFGILIAAIIRSLCEEMGSPADFTVVELGAGREEMREALSAFRYVPVDIGRGALPDRFTGVVFTNEFFDALPVEVAVRRDGGFRELRVGWNGSRFEWVEAGAVTPEVEDYIRRYIGPREEGEIVEASLAALAWLDRIAGALERGYVLTIDYGYTRRESFRFPSGTLMSYHRHTALEDVLAAPGERDITAHVCFTALEEHGRARGLETVRFETMARALLRAGEADEFAAALAGADERETTRRTLQLKTLLFGMGETFRVLLQRKA
ncbi:MAG: class I SAM-dependent methyltransferase [bacterium]|jgi:SAM-dependent MidA family methyltransferase